MTPPGAASSTPLGRLLAERIVEDGPLTLARYMALALGHPVHGYYVTRDPFGRSGDFTTAPEISQMFGELLGLWAASVWDAMGRPERVQLVELGPGRGTLMADALRAARALPGFLPAVSLHLVELSPTLREIQRRTLAGGATPATWHASLEEVPGGAPLLVLANEFFDALPIRQFVRADAGWHERLVGLGPDGALAWGLASEPERGLTTPGRPGDIVEIGAAGAAACESLAARLVREGGAALAIDYGHVRSGPGDTLQAVRRHAFVDPLASPGEADLTAHVDFAALGRAARRAGARVHGPVEQGAFLRALGIEARAATLRAKAGPAGAAAIDAALRRLVATGDGAMGRLFKAIGLSHPSLPDLPGLTPDLQPAREARAVLIEAPELSSFPRVRHAFFTREGGVSGGIYASLNGGIGSADAPADVARNRALMAERLGVTSALASLHQVHSAEAVIVDAPWPRGEQPRADGMATARPDLPLAIATADCGPVLFADPHAGVIGAAHAGWKGALGGVLEATLARMEELGARRSAVTAVLGPTIGPDDYEVGDDFALGFTTADAGNARFFRPGARTGHVLFDLPAYIVARLERAGIGAVGNLGLSTYADERRFFSYRRTTHRGEPDYGRLIAAIALTR